MSEVPKVGDWMIHCQHNGWFVQHVESPRGSRYWGPFDTMEEAAEKSPIPEEFVRIDTLNQCLRRMKAPSDKRPGIWRQGVLQVQVTRACDLACFHCTQGSNLAGKPAVMSPEQYGQALDSLSGYFGVIGMFGGNPATHPKFDRLCAILRDKVPFDQRGLWSNNLRGKAKIARETFNPKVSNLNVHLDSEAAEEIRADWPEAGPYIKGIDSDSIHGSPWVSMEDMGLSRKERLKLISKCDVNQHWSALIGIIRGELRAFFCEVAYAQAALHEGNPDWRGTGQPMPDTGLPVSPGWWRRPMKDFSDQVETHCHQCGIPMRRDGQLAVGGSVEEFSPTHAWIAHPKRPDRPVQVVTIGGPARTEKPATDYLPGLTPRHAGQRG